MAPDLTARLTGLLPLQGRRIRLVPGESGSGLSVLENDREPVGEIAFEVQPHAIAITCIEIDEHRRGFGIGAEATHLLAQAAEAAGARELHGWAPAERGLAFYFWLRVGFRPRSERPGSDGTWFMRALSPGRST